MEATPRAGSEVKLEYRLQTPHGQITWVQGSAVAMRDEAGRISGYLASITDITERTTAEEVRRHLAAIVESSDDAIISETLDGTLASWNPGAERIYGYRADEVLGQPRSIIIPPDRLDEFPPNRGSRFVMRLPTGGVSPPGA